MDMVGRLNNDNTLAVYGLGTSPIFKQTIKSNNQNFKIIENESGSWTFRPYFILFK